MTDRKMDLETLSDDLLDTAVGGAKKISSSVGKGGKNKPAHEPSIQLLSRSGDYSTS